MWHRTAVSAYNRAPEAFHPRDRINSARRLVVIIPLHTPHSLGARTPNETSQTILTLLSCTSFLSGMWLPRHG
jgi:hypothetical protein